jgi:putative NADH-flavin reductase
MKMSVIFANGEVGTVLKDKLDHAIREKKIIAFLRSSGCVQIDRDPIRKEQSIFTGSDRRTGDSSGRLSSGDPPTG